MSDGNDRSELDREYAAMTDGAGMATGPPMGTVEISGADATTFLQSLISIDLDPLDDGEGAHSLLLTPQGKLDVDFRVFRRSPTSWLLVTDHASDAARLAASLSRFKIRVDVAIDDTSSRVSGVRVRGAEAPQVARAVGAEAPARPHDLVPWDDGLLIGVQWCDLPGFDLIAPSSSMARHRAAISAAGAAVVSDEALEVVRIECGVPWMGTELDESTIPQEAFLELDAVSFDKGCFLGQELVARIDTRGHVNRLLRAVVARSTVVAGDELVVDDRSVGTVTSRAWSPERGEIALARVRREIEPPTPVTVRREASEVAAVVQEIPLRAASG